MERRQMNDDLCCMLLIGLKDENTSSTNSQAHPGLGLSSLPVGTEVSAKYRGAFCEAKVKTVIRVVKCKVVMKDCQTSVVVTDEEINGPVKLGSVVEVKHPETGQLVEGTLNKLIDNSTYTVVFDDGDERTLRRSQLCLKGDKHFIESETLDNLPLSHPEHFGTPVLQNKKAKHDGESDEWDDDSDEESPRRTMYRGRHQELVGKLMLVDFPNRKGSVVPALVVLPDANSINEVKNRDQILVRSFKDSKFMTVTCKGLKEFSRCVAIKNDDKTMRTAFEKALLYFDTKELPVGWNKEEMLGSDIEDDGDDDVEDEYASEDEPFEEKDRFVAQLYKFMDERGTPINKGPCIANKDLNLYKLFKIVEHLGGYNKVTKDMKWPVVYSKMGLPSLHQNPAHQIRTAYKKYLDAFETFYRKLGSTMGTMSRPGRSRLNSAGRSIMSPRATEQSPKPQKSAEKVTPSKDEPDSWKQKAELSTDKSEDNQEDSDVVTRRTSRNAKIQPIKEEGKEKKEELENIKKEELSKTYVDDKKEENSVLTLKQEDASNMKILNDDCTPESILKKEEAMKVKQESDDFKKEDRKSSRKITNEDEKEVTKEVKKSNGGKKQKMDEAMEEVKQEPVTPVENSTQKRMTRRKLLPSEPKTESEVKEDTVEKVERTKKTPNKDLKMVESKDKDTPKILDRRDSRSSDKKETPGKATEKKEVKLVDRIKNVEEKQQKEKKGKEDVEQDCSDNIKEPTCVEEEDFNDNVKREFPIGSKLKVKYGKGKNQKIYIAKVVDYGKDGVHQTYLVHYAGWNTRYDEWIRPDRVVSVLDKPNRSKARTPPLRSSPFPGYMKKTPPSCSPTNIPKTLPALSQHGQVFRTPQLSTAKARITRSSSSDTSVVDKETGKRLTRRRSVLNDSTGSKSPESNASSDADYASDTDRTGDYDNAKGNQVEEDDVLDVEEYEEADVKSANTSIQAEMSLIEESAPDLDFEGVPEKGVESKIEIGDTPNEKASISIDVSGQIEPCKESTDLGKRDTTKEAACSVTDCSSSSVTNRKRFSVSVVVVRDGVNVIRAGVSYGEEESQCDENYSGTGDTAVTSVADISLESEHGEAPKLEIMEKIELDQEEDEPWKVGLQSAHSGKVIEEIPIPVLLPGKIIGQLKNVDDEKAKKDTDSEKAKPTRGKKNTFFKDVKNSTIISDNSTAACLVSEISASGSATVPSTGKLGPVSVPPTDIPGQASVLSTDTPGLASVLSTDMPRPASVLSTDTPGPASVLSTDTPGPTSVLSMDTPGPASVLSTDTPGPSTYDFESEVDTQWQPETAKKWKPSQKTISEAKKVKESLIACEEDEKDQKKVKKKAKKKSVNPELIKEEERVALDDSVIAQTNIAISPPTEDSFADGKKCKKKGRKKKESTSEAKLNVTEVSENNVVETVMHLLPGPGSAEQEVRSTGKKRAVKRISESDHKDLNTLPAKVGRATPNRDSLDKLENSCNIEINIINNAGASQSPALKGTTAQPAAEEVVNETSSPHSVHSAEPHCSSSSAVEPVKNEDIQKASSYYSSQGLESLLENHESNTAYDNTPPSTPEHEAERNCTDSMQHSHNDYNPNELPSKSHPPTNSMNNSNSSLPSSASLPTLSSNPAQSKPSSESPSDNDVTSMASTDNLDATITVQQSEGSGTDQDLPSNKKRRVLEDTFNSASDVKRKRVHETRSRTAKKSPKYVSNSDSPGSTFNTPSHCPESPPTKFADFAKSPRPCKYNFSADLGEYLEGEAKCNFLINKMREIKAIYMNLKAEVATIDRRRKRARRKERESTQMPSNDKDVAT